MHDLPLLDELGGRTVIIVFPKGSCLFSCQRNLRVFEIGRRSYIVADVARFQVSKLSDSKEEKHGESTYFMVIRPMPERRVMIRKSCQNSVLDSKAKPRTSGCGESELVSGRTTSSPDSSDLSPDFGTNEQVSSRPSLGIADRPSDACD